MSVSSVGPASWYAQPQFATPAGKARESEESAGKLRIEGKTYEVKDGDIMHFLFIV